MTAAGIQLVVQFVMAAGLMQAGPKHIMFAFVDHFEPTGTVEEVKQQTSYWVKDYVAMAGKHTDADGRHPIHSYFVIAQPSIQPDQLDVTLKMLNQVTYTGYGEVELHIHHGHQDESLFTEAESTHELISCLELAKKQFNMYGALITAEAKPEVIFGFIHGMWALDNSRIFNTSRFYTELSHHEWCGVNRELDILKQEGAYADFTFPSAEPMTPRVLDMIFYAADDNSPASYQNDSNVFPVRVNQTPRDNLMIIQGPSERTNIGVKPEVYDDPPSLERMDLWVECNVHVTGNKDWIFIKVYTHGLAADLKDQIVWDNYFGTIANNFYRDIEKKYNDGKNWKLHYVSAREMFNIIKAAEAGMTGDPNNYRNFVIPPYANMVIFTENQYRLIRYVSNEVKLEILGEPAKVDIKVKGFDINADIFESDDEKGAWKLSNAEKSPGSSGELHLVDTTVSKFYDVIAVKKLSGSQ